MGGADNKKYEVGPSGIGKTSLVKLLSRLVDIRLDTIFMDSSMDTTEILGGFQQWDWELHIAEVADQVEALVMATFNSLLLGHQKPKTGMAEDHSTFKANILRQLALLEKIVSSLPQASFCDEELDKVMRNLDDLKQQVEINLNTSGKFEWVDSVLIKCLKEGTWLLVENVNLCPPAILDRLNGLLEQDGELSLTERGVDGNNQVISIKPHSNFRIFFTMDSMYGLSSKAMRNRCVEILVNHEHMNNFLQDIIEIPVHPRRPTALSLLQQSGIQDTDILLDLLDMYKIICQNADMKRRCNSSTSLRNDLSLHEAVAIKVECERKNSSLFPRKLVETINNVEVISSFIQPLLEAIDECLEQVLKSNEILFDDNALNQLHLIIVIRSLLFDLDSRKLIKFDKALNQWYVNDDLRLRIEECVWRIIVLTTCLEKLPLNPHLASNQTNLWKKDIPMRAVLFMALPKSEDLVACLLETAHSDKMIPYFLELLNNVINQKNPEDFNASKLASYVIPIRILQDYQTLLLCNAARALNFMNMNKNTSLSLQDERLVESAMQQLLTTASIPMKIKLEVISYSFSERVLSRYLLQFCDSAISLNHGQVLSSWDLTRLNPDRGIDDFLISSEKDQISMDSPVLSVLLNIATASNRCHTPNLLEELDFDKKIKHLHHIAWTNMIFIGTNRTDYMTIERQSTIALVDNLVELLEENTSGLLTKLCECYTPEEWNMLQTMFDHLVKDAEFLRSGENKDWFPIWIAIINIWLRSGSVQASIFSKIGLVPLEFRATFDVMLHDFETHQLLARTKLRTMYDEVISGHNEFCHNKTPLLLKFWESRLDQLGKLKQRHVAPRPKHLMFKEMANACSHYANNVASARTINLLCDALANLNGQLRTSAAQDLCTKVDMWLNSNQRMLEELSSKYETLHYDYLEEVLLAGTQISHGLIIMKNTLLKYINSNAQLSSLVRDLFGFPSLQRQDKSITDVVDRYLSGGALELLKENIWDEEDLEQPEKIQLNIRSLQLAALKDMLNEVLVKEELDTNIWNKCNKLITEIVVELLNDSEKRVKDPKDYIYRTANYGVILTDEEQLERDFENWFPTFSEDEFIGKPSGNVSTSNLKKVQSFEEYTVEVSYYHSYIVRLFMKTTREVSENLPQTQEIDWADGCLQRYPAACDILEKHKHAMPASLDKLLSSSFLILLSKLHCTNNPRSQGDKLNDFYKDSNIEDVRRGAEVVQNLLKDVLNLLKQYPDNPILNEILVITDRIIHFPITSPLSCFKTGYHLLLTKIQDWEIRADQLRSLATHLAALNKVIYDWMILELSYWKDLLNISATRINNATIVHWWPLLFSLVSSTYNGEVESTTKLLEALDDFMTTSSLGEFRCRLSLLYTCYCHFSYPEKNPSRVDVALILLNVYKHHRMFLMEVEEKLNELTKPIERDLKNLVKTIRWNPRSFVSAKDSVRRTQKSALTLLRKFETVLKLPYKSLVMSKLPLLQPVKHWSVISENFNITSLYIADNIKASYHRIHEEKVLGQEECLDSFFNISDYLDDVISLNELQINKDETLAKQKSKAKNIKQQRMNFYSTLFKTLEDLNFSYRRGIVGFDENEYKCKVMHAPVVDVPLMLQQLCDKKEDQQLLEVFQESDEHFQSCVDKFSKLLEVIVSPSTDVGIQNLQKMKGFSCAGMMEIVKGKWDCSESVQLLGALRHLLEQVKSLAQVKEGEVLVIKDWFQHWKLLDKTVETIASSTEEVVSSTGESLQRVQGSLKGTMGPVVSHLNMLIESTTMLHHHNPDKARASCQSQYINLLLNLEHYVSSCQFDVMLQIGYFKVLSRLMSVLLVIFIDFITKGFRIPPELADEEGKEGKATGGMGFGDGEGETDMSKDIVSQDQLEEALPNTDEPQEKEEKPCEEEEDGIDMSEDFGGLAQDTGGKGSNDEDSDDMPEDDEDVDKEMGPTSPDANELDKKVGSDSEEGEGEDGEDGAHKSGEKTSEPEMAGKSGKQPEEQQELSEESPTEKENMDEEIQGEDDQVDQTYGQAFPELEIEPLDLSDEMDLDGNDQQEENGAEENNFDIDKMKELEPEEGGPEEAKDIEPKTADESDAMSTSDIGEEKGKDDEMSHDEDDAPEMDSAPVEHQQDDQEDQLHTEETPVDHGISKNPSEEKVSEVVDKDTKSAGQDGSQDECQEGGENDHGVGQAQVKESEMGHHQEQSSWNQGGTHDKAQDYRNQSRRSPWHDKQDRALGDSSQPLLKRLKTVDISVKNTEDSDEEANQNDYDLYQHVKDTIKTSDNQTLDSATKEEVDKQLFNQEPTKEQDENMTLNLDAKEINEENEIAPPQPDDKVPSDGPAKKRPKTSMLKSGEDRLETRLNMQEEEGDIVPTLGVARPQENIFVDNSANIDRLDPLEDFTPNQRTLEQIFAERKEALSSEEALSTWKTFLEKTLSQAQDLSEQLRIVLHPTQASGFKGDYRTGRRINMRKIIPYIASEFRKDKIWLRRTKLTKRDYQIILAVDDSLSMSDVQAKERTLEYLALVTQAFGLLEVGDVGVVCYGIDTRILHALGQPFTHQSGASLIQNLSFTQAKTNVSQMVDFVTSVFQSNTMKSSSSTKAQLLLIVSDGRNINSEGPGKLERALTRSHDANIFTLYIILDDQESSILDIERTTFENSAVPLRTKYMEKFPFHYYIILNDTRSLSTVMADALKQFLELMTQFDKEMERADNSKHVGERWRIVEGWRPQVGNRKRRVYFKELLGSGSAVVFGLSATYTKILQNGDSADRTVLRTNIGAIKRLNVVSKQSPDVFEYIDQMKSPRLIKTHLPIELLPKEVWTKKPKDDKSPNLSSSSVDVNATENEDQHVMINLSNGQESHHPIEEPLPEALPFSPFWGHVLGYWRRKDEFPIIFNTYEEMKRDLLSVVLKTCRFLCKSYTDTELESLLDHLSFDKMKENPSVNYEHVVTRKRLTEETKDLTFFRKGEAGGWRKTMSPELAARFDAWTADKLKGSDYEVDTM
uniref:VWFA domain-containing protein n=1 Tax=Timema bartmani TaxID=61472 RepID=A0A7R9HW77_9NEOP|nr:unnamed protein product [Timema bartmani]